MRLAATAATSNAPREGAEWEAVSPPEGSHCRFRSRIRRIVIGWIFPCRHTLGHSHLSEGDLTRCLRYRESASGDYRGACGDRRVAELRGRCAGVSRDCEYGLLRANT